MKKAGIKYSSKLYELKRQYPVIKQIVRGIGTVEYELNRLETENKREKGQLF